MERQVQNHRSSRDELGVEGSLVLSAVAEELGGTMANAAAAAGLGPKALRHRVERDATYSRKSRRAVNRLVQGLRENGIVDSPRGPRQRFPNTKYGVMRLFRSVLGLVERRIIPQHAALNLVDRKSLRPEEKTKRKDSAGAFHDLYYRRRAEYPEEFEEACREVGLHDPRRKGPVPENLLTRARMKRAGLLEGLGYGRYYISRHLGMTAVWLDGAARDFPKYYNWLCEQQRLLPKEHRARVNVYDQRGKLVGVTPWNPRRREARKRYADRKRAGGGEHDPFRQSGPAQPHHSSVILQGPGQSVLIRGKQKPALTRAQYAVISALVKVAPDNLPLDLLVEKSGSTDARRVLHRLAKSDPDWGAVINLAGVSGRGYRIVP